MLSRSVSAQSLWVAGLHEGLTLVLGLPGTSGTGLLSVVADPLRCVGGAVVALSCTGWPQFFIENLLTVTVWEFPIHKEPKPPEWL